MDERIKKRLRFALAAAVTSAIPTADILAHGAGSFQFALKDGSMLEVTRDGIFQFDGDLRKPVEPGLLVHEEDQKTRLAGSTDFSKLAFVNGAGHADFWIPDPVPAKKGISKNFQKQRGKINTQKLQRRRPIQRRTIRRRP